MFSGVSDSTERSRPSARVTEPIVVVDYDPAWPEAFARERDRIAAALGELAFAIEHHGSTAVPGLAAKPIIDIMVAVQRLDDVSDHTARLVRAGYDRRPVGDIPGRLYFQRREEGRRHAHLSLAEQGSDFWLEHIAFRDALRADQELARRYAALKRELAARYRDDRLGYTDAKTEFIRSALAAARGRSARLGWAGESRR